MNLRDLVQHKLTGLYGLIDKVLPNTSNPEIIIVKSLDHEINTPTTYHHKPELFHESFDIICSENALPNIMHSLHLQFTRDGFIVPKGYQKPSLDQIIRTLQQRIQDNSSNQIPEITPFFQVIPFHQAPLQYQELSSFGGDEDFIILISLGEIPYKYETLIQRMSSGCLSQEIECPSEQLRIIILAH